MSPLLLREPWLCSFQQDLDQGRGGLLLLGALFQSITAPYMCYSYILWHSFYFLLDNCSLPQSFLPTNICTVKAMVFPVVTYGCESWTIKKAVCQKIDAFELCCWRRLLRVPWTASKFNQSILKEISPEYSLERLMLKLKCQYFGHFM